MADIFISYAKTDRLLASKLAAMLEAEGWTTWWDTTLIPGDDFRNEIMTQLGRARAVIVIWTDASIKSDWVRSEAGRAQADRKLIPVKLPHLVYKDLPPPFDVLHTENVGEEDKIKAAVVAQLAKPAVEPSAWALLGKGFKWELLTWWGIIGGAITLFVAISTTLKLADWARVLVEHWKEWTHAFWVWAFGWLGIHLPPGSPPILSFLLFGSLLAIGQAVRFNMAIKTQIIGDKYESKSFQLISWRIILCLVVTILFINRWVGPEYVFQTFKFGIRSVGFPGDDNDVAYLFNVMSSSLVLVAFARVRLYAAVAISLMAICWTIVTYNQLSTYYLITSKATWAVAFTMLPILSLILLSVAPAKAIARRLIFLALGLLLLIGLNELSKLGLDLAAPKLQG
jgi:TIR domain